MLFNVIVLLFAGLLVSALNQKEVRSLTLSLLLSTNNKEIRLSSDREDTVSEAQHEVTCRV